MWLPKGKSKNWNDSYYQNHRVIEEKTKKSAVKHISALDSCIGAEEFGNKKTQFVHKP